MRRFIWVVLLICSIVAVGTAYDAWNVEPVFHDECRRFYIAIDSTKAYLLGRDSLYLYDISAPVEPSMIMSIPFDYIIDAFFCVVDNYAFMEIEGDDNTYLRIIDFSNPQ